MSPSEKAKLSNNDAVIMRHPLIDEYLKQQYITRKKNKTLKKLTKELKNPKANTTQINQ